MNFDFSNVTLALLFLSLCGLLLWYYFCITLPLSKIPSCRVELFMLRTFLSKGKITTTIHEEVASLGRKYISEGLYVIWILKPILLIFKEEYIKNVLNDNIEKAAEYRFFHDGFGVGLFTGNKHLWKKRRKMFNPLFRLVILKDKINIFNKYSRKLVEDFSKRDLTASIDIEKPLKKFSFNVMSAAIMDLDPEESSNVTEAESLFEVVDIASEFIIHRFVKPWLNCTKLFKEGRVYLRKMEMANKIAKKFFIDMKESLCTPKASEISNEYNTEPKATSKSFVELLLEHHINDPEFAMQDLLNEMKLLISAGYDTVATSLNWILFLLGQHPYVQNLIYEEVMFLKDDLSCEDLQHLTYTECVIKESLRLYPPIPLYGRSAENDIQLGKYKIPKGTSIFIDVYMYHRNPDVFPNPDKYDPSRFLNKNSEKSQLLVIPFSMGLRNCIGQAFAMMELKTALAHILRKFKIVSEDDYCTARLSYEVLLKPDKPIYLKFIPRD